MALQAQATLSDRADALCNATLLNAEWRYCALNAAEESAAADITRAEEQLAATQRRAQRIAERVRDLSARPDLPSPYSAGGAGAAAGGDAAVSWGAGRGGALRFGRNGKAVTGSSAGLTVSRGAPGGPERRGLWGGAEVLRLQGTQAGAVVKSEPARREGCRRGRGGRATGGRGKASREAQRWQTLSQQVGMVQGQLQELQELQGEVGRLFEEAAREYR